MTNKKKSLKYKSILPLSFVAAAWMIAGPAWLETLGLQSDKLIDLITFVPAMGVMLMIVMARPGFIACERHTFKRILGIK